MYVSAGGAAGHSVAECYEGDSLGSEISHQRLALRAIRMYRDVHRVAMIESKVIVDCRLAKGADGQHAPKLSRKELLYFGGIFERPFSRPVETY